MPETAASLLLAKLLPVFAYPLGLALLLALLGTLAARLCLRRLARLSFAAALAILWLASTPMVANRAAGWLERQYPPRTLAETPEADVAIVLGGAVAPPQHPRTDLELTGTSDRVLHAARLYRAGKVQRILVSAGNLPRASAARPEAELIRELLVEWGVAPDAIEVGGESRNTYENAMEIQRMRKARAFRSALLVTSASHMPRAMATFRRAGIPVTASATDVNVVDDDGFDPLQWLPSAGALAMTTGAVRECIGYLAYKARGYL